MPRAEASIEVFASQAHCLALLCDVEAHQGLAREIQRITAIGDGRPPAEVRYDVTTTIAGQRVTTSATFGMRLEGHTLHWLLQECALLTRGRASCRVQSTGEEDACELFASVELETTLKVPVAVQETTLRELLGRVMERFRDWLESQA